MMRCDLCLIARYGQSRLSLHPACFGTPPIARFMMKRSILAKTLLVAALSLGAISGVYAGNKPVQQYPNSHREAPQNDLRSERDAKQLNAAFAALQKNDTKQAAGILNKLQDNSRS